MKIMNFGMDELKSTNFRIRIKCVLQKIDELKYRKKPRANWSEEGMGVGLWLGTN